MEGMQEEKEFKIEQALDRLEKINSELSKEDIELKESLELYAEGAELAAKCKEHLVGVEKQLQIINGENQN